MNRIFQAKRIPSQINQQHASNRPARTSPAIKPTANTAASFNRLVRTSDNSKDASSTRSTAGRRYFWRSPHAGDQMRTGIRRFLLLLLHALSICGWQITALFTRDKDADQHADTPAIATDFHGFFLDEIVRPFRLVPCPFRRRQPAIPAPLTVAVSSRPMPFWRSSSAFSPVADVRFAEQVLCVAQQGSHIVSDSFHV